MHAYEMKGLPQTEQFPMTTIKVQDDRCVCLNICAPIKTLPTAKQDLVVLGCIDESINNFRPLKYTKFV